MELLYPIGLLSAAGILIPLLIHLWKVNQGRVLKIGSISLLGVSSQKSSKSFKLTDWLLFLLRCLLILLLAFLLAKPMFDKDLEKGKQQGWVLLDQTDFPKVYQENKLTIDSLLQLGYEIHDYNIGFKPLELKDTLKLDTGGEASAMFRPALLKQLNETLPENYRVYLYSDRRLNQLGEELPALSYDLQHRVIPRKDTLSSWTTNSFGKTFEATSTPSATQYKTSQQDTATIHILMYESGYPEDKAYLSAAIGAIARFTERKIIWRPWSKANFQMHQPDLVFWLADQPLDPVLKSAWKDGASLFSYAQGKTQNITSFLTFNKEVMANGGDAVTLSKRIIARDSNGISIWADGFGDPLLTLENHSGLNEYRFYARLNPKWTGFVWNEQFVRRLMPILIGAAPDEVDFGFENHAEDQRTYPAGQTLTLSAKKTGTTDQIDRKMPLSPIIWVFAWLVFVLERLLSIRNKNKSAA